MCVCCLLFVYVCLCVCMYVCVCVCVCWPRRVQKPHVYPSDNGLVPTRSGGCTPRVWPTPCGADFERNANPTLCTCYHRFQCNQPLVHQSVSPYCRAVAMRAAYAARWWFDTSIRGNKLIHTYTHKHTYTHTLTYIHTNYTHTSVMDLRVSLR